AHSECLYLLRGYVRITMTPGQDQPVFPGTRLRLRPTTCERLADGQAQARIYPANGRHQPNIDWPEPRAREILRVVVLAYYSRAVAALMPVGNRPGLV